MVAKRENWKMYKYKLWRLIISDNKEMEIYRSMWGIIHEYKVHPEGAHHVPIKDIKSTPEIPEKSVIIGNDHKN